MIVHGEPKNKREARQWVRQHWADLIRASDMGSVGDIENDHIDAVWEDECVRISARLAPGLFSPRKDEM